MKCPRREKLEKFPESERKAYLRKFIKFSWFIDEHSLLDAILSLNLWHSKSDYLVDDDFSKYVFKGATVEDALFIANKLDSEANQDSWYVNTGMNHCTKARIIRSEMKHKFYQENPEICLASVRRTNCGCHETGSLAKRKDI